MAECQINESSFRCLVKHIASRIEKAWAPYQTGSFSEDMDRAIHTAKSIKIGDEQRILHVIPQEFTIDYQEGIKTLLVYRGKNGESVSILSRVIMTWRNIIKSSRALRP